MARIDHHIHTTRHSPDSIIADILTGFDSDTPDSIFEPVELIERARFLGLDGVVITEHDRIWDPDELEELSEKAGDLTVLSGAEVSAREGHFLVYGLTDLDECPPGVLLADLLKVVRAQGAAIVAAHPYRWGQEFDAIVEEHGPAFDALERASNNVDPEMRIKIDSLLGRIPTFGATGSSDAHEVDVIGCYYTEFAVEINTMADFVRALRSRSGRPRHRPDTFLTGGPVEALRI